MIIVERQKLKFLLAGRPLELEVHREFRKGRDYAVGATFRKTACRAKIEDIEQIGGKTWRIRIRQHTEETPIYLAKQAVQADYTHLLSKAVVTEPEPLGPHELQRYSKPLSERDDEERRRRANERLAQQRAERKRVA